ncbi:hypothetical protein BT69DRAFT_1276903 [Atractiella rhizophila]|nr:hypothetical protein BT69DRAFT_1276903 [Atractiella rhizophila]
MAGIPSVLGKRQRFSQAPLTNNRNMQESKQLGSDRQAVCKEPRARLPDSHSTKCDRCRRLNKNCRRFKFSKDGEGACMRCSRAGESCKWPSTETVAQKGWMIETCVRCRRLNRSCMRTPWHNSCVSCSNDRVNCRWAWIETATNAANTSRISFETKSEGPVSLEVHEKDTREVCSRCRFVLPPVFSFPEHLGSTVA